MRIICSLLTNKCASNARINRSVAFYNFTVRWEITSLLLVFAFGCTVDKLYLLSGVILKSVSIQQKSSNTKHDAGKILVFNLVYSHYKLSHFSKLTVVCMSSDQANI